MVRRQVLPAVWGDLEEWITDAAPNAARFEFLMNIAEVEDVQLAIGCEGYTEVWCPRYETLDEFVDRLQAERTRCPNCGSIPHRIGCDLATDDDI